MIAPGNTIPAPAFSALLLQFDPLHPFPWFNPRSHPLWVWVFVGLAVGWITGYALRGRGLGCITDILLGLAGGVLGGWLVTNYNLMRGEFYPSVAAAALVAFVFVALSRIFGGQTSK